MASAENNSQEQQRSPRNILVTARAKHCIRKVIKIGGRLCCHPYDWNDNEDYPVFTTSELRIVGWSLNILISIVYTIFLLVQSVRVNLSAQEHVSNKALLWFSLNFFSLPVIYHAQFLMSREKLSDFMRNSFSYYQKFEELYVRETARPSKMAVISEIYNTCLAYTLALNTLSFIAYGLARLDGPEQISSVVPGYLLLQIPVNILFCSYYYPSLFTNVAVVAFTLQGSVFALFDVMKELIKTSSAFTTGRLRRPLDRIRAYRVLQLQASAIDDVYWLIVLYAKFAVMILVAFCIYGAIRLDGMVAFVLGVLGAAALILLMVWLSSFAEFYSGSLEALVSLRTMTTRSDVLADKKLTAWFRKSVRSLRVARLSIGGMYYVDKELVLDVVGIISNGIFFLLVNFEGNGLANK